MQPTSPANQPALLRAMFDAAVASAQPSLCLAQHLPPAPKGRLGAGKASAAMAQALEAHWPGPLEGLVVTRYGYAVPCERIEIVEAAHPVPDAAGLEATARVRQLVSGLTEDDLVIALISGGGSALLVAPGEGISLADKQAVNAALLKSGANIAEMNCVRRHLSQVKGGRLAAACHPAHVVTLLISDVPGDNPAHVVMLSASSFARNARTLSGDARLQNITTRIITAPQIALEAAAKVAEAAGYTPYILGDSLEGEARDLGLAMAGIARQVVQRGQPFKTPCVLLSGGETTVTVTGSGRGGRNVEFLLSLAVALDGLPGVHAIAGDTDGVDGAEEIAGAIIAPDTLARAWAAGIQPRKSLDNNDGHGFFQALGDSVITGPTLTNVNDFRAIIIDTPAGAA